MKNKTSKQVEAVSSYVYKPHMEVKASMMPEVKEWEVGKTYTFKNVEVKMIGINQGNGIMEGEGKSEITARFEVLKVDGKEYK